MKDYTKPSLRVVDFQVETNFCLSGVEGAGGTTTGYGEDDESLFN